MRRLLCYDASYLTIDIDPLLKINHSMCFCTASGSKHLHLHPSNPDSLLFINELYLWPWMVRSIVRLGECGDIYKS